MYNAVTTLAPSFLIGSSSFLQIRWTNIKATLMKNSFLNHGWIVFWICLKLSEFQLNHMIPSISELLLKFRRIQPIFRKIQICVSVNSGLRLNCSECWLKCLLNVSELWLNRLLNLSEFQLNHISELLLKFGRIQPIFRKIQICVSENSGTYTLSE